MQRPPSLFEGVAADALDAALAGLELRRFSAGAVIIAEGDYGGEMYVLRSGTADVLLVDRKGAEHVLSTVHPGEAIGEMSLLTESPASATVRAAEDVELLVLEAGDLDALLEALPHVQRNLIRTLSSRLARVSRLALHEQPGHLVVVEGGGDAGELPFALAASIAWHTRSATLHVALGAAPPVRDAFTDARVGALTLAGDVEGAFAPERIDATLDELLRSYDHVVLQLPRAWATRLVDERRVRAGADGLTIEGRSVAVPELTRDDRAPLERGLLPNETEAGKAIGTVARELANLKVGLALGAGSIRGYAHVGALRALERHGVPIDCLAGTSIGATVAGAYAHFRDVDRVEEFLDGLGVRMFRPTVSRKSLLTTAAMRRYARRTLGDPLLEELSIPTAVVATDVETQDEVVLRRGHAIPAVFASAAVPGVFPAVRVGNRTLVDGGVVNPVPASVAASLGADVVVGIRLVHSGGIQADEVAEEGEGPVPSAVAAIMRSIELLQTRIATDSGSTPLILITPEFGSIPAGKMRHFRDGRRFIEAGEAAVEEALPRLGAALPWLRPTPVDAERLVAARG
jgi:NTE family protein